MIRCSSCYYYNDELQRHCEKCGTVLIESDLDVVENSETGKIDKSIEQDQNAEEKVAYIYGQSATSNVSENTKEHNVSTNEIAAIDDLYTGENCKKCQYLLRTPASLCPNCGVDNVKEIPLEQHPKMLLQHLQGGEEIKFEGSEIKLNRANLSPNNHSISSIEHATVSFKDGQWILEDKSSNGATFLQVTHPHVLEDGMLILLGDVLFQFRKV